ncbi:sensor domain-containing diguanylate cyclase [Klebsiella variicola]|uniref:sensor domain-containing diguanylate cyclase n=1 Tax=Klebsiella variicola TaxID=244366 RepID=UPI002B05B2C4|nr:diguanylate cyclase [Klebsiella variicola]
MSNYQRRQAIIAHSIDVIADMVIWLDKDGQYIFVNKAATELLEYSSDELLSLKVWDIDPLFSEEKWYAHWRELEEKKSLRIETVNRKKSGQDIPIEVTASMVSFGSEKYNCSVVRDNSEHKRVEKELRSLNEVIFHLSITDGLTGISNRRYFDEVFIREIKRHSRTLVPLSVILLDVDYFKEYNDHYGHVAGDECLQKIGQVLADIIKRPGELVARYGGEEFAFILPETSEDGVKALAEEIKNRINSLSISHVFSPETGCITCSFGVLTILTPGLSPGEILNTVDQLLYNSKRAGRNKISCGVK